MQGTLEGDAECEGEHWLLAPFYCPGLSITMSPVPHLTRTTSKSLAQALLCSSDQQPRLMNNTTLFHAKPLGKPGSSLLGARCIWGLAGTKTTLLCTFCTRLAGLMATVRAALAAHCLAPRPAAASASTSSPVPLLGICCKPSWGWRERGGGRDLSPQCE